MRLFIKVCGITRPEDAALATRLGVDAVGLNFYEGSKRHVTVSVARRVVRELGPFVWRVGVFVNAPLSLVARTAQALGLHAVQLHGDEPARDLRALRALGLTTLRAVHVGAQGPTRAAPLADALVLDAAQPGYGGGGVTFDWGHARALARERRVLLAGGLTPHNVARAIRTVRPFGVDVASGVERVPREKDPRRLAAFIRAVRAQEKT